jgi:hypothetical protein
MACLQFSELVSKFRNNFLETLKLKRKSRRNLDIVSQPRVLPALTKLRY